MTERTALDDVRTSLSGGIGRIVLDRPAAMNALNLAMVRRIDTTLREWRDDPGVDAVLIDGAGDRGLCAGGDIKMFYASALADGSDAREFWAAEYRMNALIASYPKPVVAVMFGAVLGGGVGVSAHAGQRVVTESTKVGMPEVGIGFVPDVGGTWLLAHAPGELGPYLALTGRSVGAADAIACGLADEFVPAIALDEVRAATDATALFAAIAANATQPPTGELASYRPWIDACFTATTAHGIVGRLRAADDPAAADAADLISTRSPEAVELTLLAVRAARGLPNLEDALAMEYAISSASLDRADFAEGIRAQVIDKDRTPRWRPASLADVDVVRLREAITGFASRSGQKEFTP